MDQNLVQRTTKTAPNKYDPGCGMYIPLSDDKHQKVRDSSKQHTGNLRQIQSKTKCSPRQNSVQEFFSDGWEKSSWTEFCLGLNFVLG